MGCLYLLNGYNYFYEIWSVWCRDNPGAISLRWSWLVNVGMAYYNKSKSAHTAFCTSGALPITVNTTAQTLACVLIFAPSPPSFGPTSMGSAVRGVRVVQGAWPPFIPAFSSSLFMYLLIYTFIYAFIYLFIYAFIFIFIYAFIHLFIYNYVGFSPP